MDKPKPRGRPPRIQMTVGLRFGRLVTTSLDTPRVGVGNPGRPTGSLTAGCRCDCGSEVTVIRSNLTARTTRSCGCLKQDRDAWRLGAAAAEARAAAAALLASGRKKCPGCDAILPLSEFTLNAGNPDGRARRCRACRKEDGKGRHDPERGAKHARWVRANPRKVLANSARYRESVRSQVFSHYGRACACCGATEDLSIDHIAGDGRKHRAEVFGTEHAGGTRIYAWLVKNGLPEGFQTLCRSCNSSKQTGERCRLVHAAA